MGADASISYIVVNYRVGELLRRNLQQAAGALARFQHELLVVENGGEGEAGKTREVLRDIPGVTVLAPSRNLGFGGGVNLAARKARGKYLLVANPDNFLDDDAVLPLVAALEDDVGAGIAGPQVLDPDGSVQESARRFPSARTGLFGRTSLMTRIFPNNRISREELLASQLPEDRPHPVDWVSGACFLTRASAFAEVGGFDEGYFLYWEDADLCRRLAQAGYRTLFVPMACVTHLVGRSMDQAKVRSVLHFHRSAHRYYRTHNIPGAPKVFSAAVAAGLGMRAALVLGREGLRRVLRRRQRDGAGGAQDEPPPEAASGLE